MVNSPPAPPLPRCVVCQQPCIPMADYEHATCVGCDCRVEALLTRATITARITRPYQPRGPLRPCGTHAAFNRHKLRGEEPCDSCKDGERAFQSEAKRRARRVAAERRGVSARPVLRSVDGAA